MSLLKESIRKHLLMEEVIADLKSNITIDFQITKHDTGVNFNKKSFMSCDITLFQKVFHPINSELTMDSVKNISDSIISNVLEGNQYFEFTRKK